MERVIGAAVLLLGFGFELYAAIYNETIGFFIGVALLVIVPIWAILDR